MPTSAMPNIANAWEFIATSTASPGLSTGVEVALQQGTVFSNDAYHPNGQISASGTQLSFVGFTPGAGQNSPPDIHFGGNCTPSEVNSLTGSISGVGGSMNFTFTENGFIYNVTAILDASGKSIDSGTYTVQSGAGCGGDTGGTLTGEIVSKLSGTYTGPILSPCPTSDSSCTPGAVDNATATLSQSGTALTVNLLLTGADNTSFTLTGPVAGNYFSVQGTFMGSAVFYQGYVKYVFDSADGLYDTPTVYLENVACSSSNSQSCTNLLTVLLVP